MLRLGLVVVFIKPCMGATDHNLMQGRGHFIVRRLERRYDKDEIRKWYDQALACRE
jgi:hypothetical protein